MMKSQIHLNYCEAIVINKDMYISLSVEMA